MTPIERKKISVISKYAFEKFSDADWQEFAQITESIDLINDHPRLLRASSFGDDDYLSCIAQVFQQIFNKGNNYINEIIDHFDIDFWYQQKEPEKYKRIFDITSALRGDFWKEGYLKVFISHLSNNKERMSAMKSNLDKWGVHAFIAHEDIEPSKEWMNEIEIALETMDILIAVVEPGFKESNWCAQEVGYALGRKVDVIPLSAGFDPFGFFGKFQSIKIKGKKPEEASKEIIKLLLKKSKFRNNLLQCMRLSFNILESNKKIEMTETIDSWKILKDPEIKTLIESISLSQHEKITLRNIIARVDAFKINNVSYTLTEANDIPF